MKILAFDPGHQTGVAFLVDQYWQFTMTVLTPNLSEKLFLGLSAITQPDIIVVEEAPLHARDSESMNNYHYILHWFRTAGFQIETVMPGQWKGMVPNKPNISGQHQLDAVTMAMWFYRHESRKLINIFGTEGSADGPFS